MGTDWPVITVTFILLSAKLHISFTSNEGPLRYDSVSSLLDSLPLSSDEKAA
jgi:hypothetical protein